MKATIKELKNTTDKLRTYAVFVVEEQKTRSLNIFINQEDKELINGTLIEVEEKGNWLNFVKVLKENKEEPKETPVDDADFEDAFEFSINKKKDEDITLCFRLAVLLNKPKTDRVELTKNLYEELQKVRGELSESKK